jgi:hypothetical protein
MHGQHHAVQVKVHHAAANCASPIQYGICHTVSCKLKGHDWFAPCVQCYLVALSALSSAHDACTS